jgi:hypothetical protein
MEKTFTIYEANYEPENRGYEESDWFVVTTENSEIVRLQFGWFTNDSPIGKKPEADQGAITVWSKDVSSKSRSAVREIRQIEEMGPVQILVDENERAAVKEQIERNLSRAGHFPRGKYSVESFNAATRDEPLEK